jgi:vitamin B12 transporter
MSGRFIWLSSVVLGLSAFVYADEVIITASRTAESLDETLASVTIIDRAQIEALQPRSVDEILQAAEGVSFARNGGIGQITAMYMRGGESDHVLWLIDGVRIGSVSAGLPALQDLPVDLIERIEIVRGPRSSLYGADAMGGVVQIFTRRSAATTPSFRIGGGSNGSRQASAGIRFGDELLWWDLQAAHLQTDGTNACLGAPFPPGGGCFTFEPDRDPYESTSVNLRAGYRFGTHEIEGFVQRAEADVAFDGSFYNRSDLVNQVAGAKWSSQWSNTWRSQWQVGQSRDESRSTRIGLDGAGIFDTRRDSVSWQNEWDTRAGRWIAGVDWLRDQISGTTAYDRDTRENRSVYASYSTEWGGTRVGLSARHDDDQQFGSTLTGSVALGRAVGPLQVYASAGTAFKAPTFNDLYFPGFSNPDLDPERAKTVEVGVKARPDWGSWSVSAYRSDIKDLVAFDFVTFTPQNLAAAALTGVEGRVRWRRGAWQFDQSASWLEARDRSAGTSIQRELPRRPSWQARSALSWQTGSVDWSASVLFTGRRYDDLANTVALGSYALLDLAASWRASAAWDVQFKVANAFDRQYASVNWYSSLGREVLVNVRYRASR